MTHSNVWKIAKKREKLLVLVFYHATRLIKREIVNFLILEHWLRIVFSISSHVFSVQKKIARQVINGILTGDSGMQSHGNSMCISTYELNTYYAYFILNDFLNYFETIALLSYVENQIASMQ